MTRSQSACETVTAGDFRREEVREAIKSYIRERNTGAFIYEVEEIDKRAIQAYRVQVPNVGGVWVRVDHDSREGKDFISYEVPKQV